MNQKEPDLVDDQKLAFSMFKQMTICFFDSHEKTSQILIRLTNKDYWSQDNKKTVLGSDW